MSITSNSERDLDIGDGEMLDVAGSLPVQMCLRY